MDRSVLHDWLKRRPFQPFRVHLMDGRIFDIHRPRTNLLGQTFVKIGVPEPDNPGPLSCDHTVYVPLNRITQLEPLLASSEACGKE